ncbi:MAG: efflux RND transporter permease subunit, partial [Betaproteobacteria bacterium]
DTLRIATAGDFDRALPKLNLSQRQVPIVVRLPEQARQDPALLAQMPISTPRGPVQLGTVASITLESGPAQIDRYDRRRNVNLDVELNGQALGDVAAAAQKLPSVLQ